jgi:hypothetical protein
VGGLSPHPPLRGGLAGRWAWAGCHPTPHCVGGLQDGRRGLAVTSPPTTWRACRPVGLGWLSPHPPLRGGLAGRWAWASCHLTPHYVGGLQAGGPGRAVTSPPTTWGACRTAGVGVGRLSPHPPLRGGLAGRYPPQPVPGRARAGRVVPVFLPFDGEGGGEQALDLIRRQVAGLARSGRGVKA